MILGIGTDLANIERIERTLERFGDRFRNRVFTDVEQRKAERRVDTPGTYAGLSAEFSGRGYDNHRFAVIAHGPEDWQSFLEGEQ